MKSKEEWEKHYEREDPYGAGGRWLLEKSRIQDSFEAIPKGHTYEKALDLASGEGHFTSLLCNVAKKVVAVELSVNASTRAKKRLNGRNVEFIVANMSDVQFPSGSFDLICAIEAIRYCDNKEKEIDRWCNWLQPNGVLIATGPILPDYFTWNEFLNLFLKRFRKVTYVPVSSKFIFAKLANHHLLPFPEMFYDLSMQLTRRFPRYLTKHIAVVVNAADRIV